MYSKKQPQLSMTTVRPQSACMPNFLSIPEQDNSETASITGPQLNTSQK